MISKSSHLMLLGLLLVLLASRANCDFNVDDIFTVVSSTSNSTSNSTTTNCTANQTNCSTNGNETNSTNQTNTSAYCTDVTQQNCVIPEALIIQFLNQQEIAVFMDNGKAILCPAGCIVCTGATTCKICEIGFVLNSSTKSCVPCKGCQTCDAADPSKCLTCFLPQVLSASGNGTCDTIVCTNTACQTCSDASTCLTCYQGYSLYDNDCVACIQGCKKCTGSKTNCDADQCMDGYVYLVNSKTGVNECVQCSAGCASCNTDNTNNCVGCVKGFYSKLDDTQSPAANQCYPCLKNCKTCSSSTSCSKCFRGYKLTSDGLRCVSKCDKDCNTCVQNQPKQCLSCFGNDAYNSATKTCVNECNATGTCISCSSLTALVNGYCNKCTVTDSNCDGCLSSDLATCTSCVQGYYLSENSCSSCPSECSICLTQLACTSCKDGYYLSVQSGKQTGNCLACIDPCKSCGSDGSICTSCIDGFSLSGTKCTGTLNVGYSVTFNSIFSEFPLIFSRFVLYLLVRIRRVRSSFGRGRLCHLFSRSGSTIVAGTVSPDSSTDATAMSSQLDAALAPGTVIAGVPITASSVSVNGVSSSTSNLGLILGVSIPLIVLVAAILIFIAVKLSKDERYKEYEDVDKNSLSNKEQQYNNV